MRRSAVAAVIINSLDSSLLNSLALLALNIYTLYIYISSITFRI